MGGAVRKKHRISDQEHSSSDSSSEIGQDNSSGTESNKSDILPLKEDEDELTGWESSKVGVSWKTHDLILCHSASGNWHA